MKTSTKIWTLLAIVSNVALLYFFRPILDSIGYGPEGIYFDLTWETYIGLAMFAIACVSGSIVFLRFIKSQPLNRQIFFSTIPPTATFVFLMLFFFTINTAEQTDIVTAVRAGLGISDASAKYIWIVVIVVAYALFLYITYTNLAKPIRKIERAVEMLRNGKTKQPIKVGNNKQFKEIEKDLNQINENYKKQEKVLSSLMPDKKEIEIQNQKIVEKIDVNSKKTDKKH